MEDPIKMNDLGGTPISGNLQISSTLMPSDPVLPPFLQARLQIGEGRWSLSSGVLDLGSPGPNWGLDLIIVEVSQHAGTPVIIHFRLGFSMINHPFWGIPIYGTPIWVRNPDSYQSNTWNCMLIFQILWCHCPKKCFDRPRMWGFIIQTASNSLDLTVHKTMFTILS